MNQPPQKKPPAEVAGAGGPPPPDLPRIADQIGRPGWANPAAQRRMEAKQPGESGANHARHHVSRKKQS